MARELAHMWGGLIKSTFIFYVGRAKKMTRILWAKLGVSLCITL